MARLIPIFVAFGILVMVGIRAAVVIRDGSRLSSQSTEAPRVINLERAPRVVHQRFDPDALVVIEVGPDGQPGQAGIDDGGNGRTDEPGELGATGSDDVCRVVPSKNALPDDSDRPRLVLQRGAYRSIEPEEKGTQDPAAQGAPRRMLVEFDSPTGLLTEILVEIPQSGRTLD